MQANDPNIEENLTNLFQKVRATDFEADPHLETRVLAELREKKRQKEGLRFWKRLALGASGVSLMLLGALGIIFTRANLPEALVGESFAVRLEVKDLKDVQIAKAKIQLPEGVTFDLEDLPELSKQREVTLVWNNNGESHFVPFVLKSNEAGVKTVTIEFYDEKSTVVAKRKLDIRLKG